MDNLTPTPKPEISPLYPNYERIGEHTQKQIGKHAIAALVADFRLQRMATDAGRILDQRAMRKYDEMCGWYEANHPLIVTALSRLFQYANQLAFDAGDLSALDFEAADKAEKDFEAKLWEWIRTDTTALCYLSEIEYKKAHPRK